MPGAPIKKWDWKYSYYPYQYYSVVAVVDGNLNGVVDYNAPNPPDDPEGNPGDLPPIAENFLNTVANYSIYGSDDPEDETPELIETIGFGDHEEVGDWPHSKRLPYRFDLSELDPEDRYPYYWVRPDDGDENYGAYSDSYWEGDEDETPDPADLRPVVATVYPSEHLIQQKGTDVTFSYSLSEEGPQPAVAQEWDFNGAAAGPTQVFTLAAPTITLTDTTGVYNCTLVAENAFGESEEFDFRITVTTDQSTPVVAGVVQDGFEPEGQATFTCQLSVGPGESYEWDFGGAASPVNPTTYVPYVTVTLATAAGVYAGAWVEVTNEAGTSDRYYFTVRIGYPPADVSVDVPDSLVLHEEATFTADYDESTSEPCTFTWNFGLAGGGEEEDYITYTPEVTLEMLDGGTHHGTLKVENTIGSETVGFDFYVHWNELRMRIVPVDDYLPGDDNFVTVAVEAYDIGHPLWQLMSLYLEYNKHQLAPPEKAYLDSSDELYWGEWNAGAIGHSPWYNDGWWLNYGPLLELPRSMFFYDQETLKPWPSYFDERKEDYNSIATNISTIGQYYAGVGTTGDFYSFRMYLPQEIDPGDFPYEAEVKNYREPPPGQGGKLTWYMDENEEVHTFSNEPSIWIWVHGD